MTLPVTKAIPCALLLNELLTNALKYAFRGGRAGTVRVELASGASGRLRLAVKDDGVGLPEGFKVEQGGKSIGLQLVTTLTEQLRGKLEVHNGAGAVFEVTFPSDP